MKIKGHIIDISNHRIYKGEITVENSKIQSITETDDVPDHYILPGFIDAHIHIESSMLVPSEFARIAVTHGTVATVSDPHEIANVLGVKGVRFMVENGKKTPLKFNFGAPSCVPATSFETAGAVISPADIDELLADPDIRYLAEMMNYPGVIFDDETVHEKLEIARRHNKPIDGHAPGLRSEKAKKYIAAGISTDHECFTYEEAQEKLQLGMKIIIREGSAAKNFDALIDLLPEHYERMMFCSDDKHPDDLIVGHINQLVVRALARGMDLYKVLQVACINPIEHYNLDVGYLREGDAADFIVVKNLTTFTVSATYIDGNLVAENGKSHVEPVLFSILNNFNTDKKQANDFALTGNSIHGASTPLPPSEGGNTDAKRSSRSEESPPLEGVGGVESANQVKTIRVIEALDGELITNQIEATATLQNGELISNPTNDILKIAMVNRYKNAPTAVAFIKGFGLKEGAIASCVGHDSHNIIAVGTDDESLCRAVNLIIENTGGISAVGRGEERILPLPVAGIMSDKDAHTVGRAYSEIDQFAKKLTSDTPLNAPFMTLSFMGLLVIPALKLSDLGLFDGAKFEFVDVTT